MTDLEAFAHVFNSLPFGSGPPQPGEQAFADITFYCLTEKAAPGVIDAHLNYKETNA